MFIYIYICPLLLASCVLNSCWTLWESCWIFEEGGGLDSKRQKGQSVEVDMDDPRRPLLSDRDEV